MQGIIMEEFGILRLKHIMMSVKALNRNIMYDDNLLHDILGQAILIKVY